MTGSSAMPTTEQAARRLSLHVGEFGWIWIGTVVLFVLSAVIAPGTMRWPSISAMMPFAAILAIVAVGQTLVIQQRGLDMSAAGMISLGGLLVAKLGFMTGSALFAIPLTLLIVLLLGAVNGLLVARLNIIPIVATLATNALLLGLVRMVSGGSPMSAPAELAAFSHFRLFGIPLTILLAVLFIIGVSVVLRSTIVGRRFVAVGANPAAAAAAGIRVSWYRVGTYAAGALCFAVAGMLYTGFIGSATPTAGTDYLMPGIAAVVVGGTPFSGGRGSVLASGVAAVFMTQLGQLVLAMGADTAIQLLVQAAAIVLAVSLRRLPGLSKLR